MKWRYHLGLLCAAGLAVLAALPASQADEPEKPKEPAKKIDPGSLPEVQDVIFYTHKRPILLRMRLFVDSKPGDERWNEFQKKLFAYLDTDGDGFLDKVEADRVIPADLLVQLFNGNPNLTGTPKAPPFEELDLNKDGKISPEELRGYYRRNEAGPYSVVTGPNRANTADQLTAVLFAALDKNNDGKLSKEELQGADKVLLRFDDNDDELLTPQELLATAIDPYTPRPPARGGPVKAAEPTSILLVPKDYPDEERGRLLTQRRALLKEVIAKYDKDRNNKLSQEESGFPKELFDELDKDKTGELTDLRLLRWLVALPDVECTVRLGQSDDKLKFIEAAGNGNRLSGLKLNQTSQTTMAMTFASSEVSVMRGAIPRTGGGPRDRQYAQFQQLFTQLDKDKKGVVTLTQLNNPQTPQFAPLRTILTLAVRADDEALTEKELQAFLEVAGAAVGSQIGVTFSDNGQGLFEMLDTNGDGRLSIREMRNAWNRLSMHANDGFISRNEIPRQYSLLVGASANQNGRQPMMVGADRGQPGPRNPVAQRGPLWFRKMDVNGDGDVSEREFLGSMEDFRRINTSGDGLISVEEAEKADEWFRQKVQQK